jgi:hypothetical protein
VADRNEGLQVGHHGDDPLPCDVAGQVHPVRADVRDGSQGSAQLGLEAPVPVGVEQEPVLQVMAGNEPHITEPSLLDELMQVPAYWVEADVEVDGMHAAARPCEPDELARFH